MFFLYLPKKYDQLENNMIKCNQINLLKFFKINYLLKNKFYYKKDYYLLNKKEKKINN